MTGKMTYYYVYQVVVEGQEQGSTVAGGVHYY